jgi:Ca2+-transporting ATPase
VNSLSDVAVFARVSPEHKLRIVESFQASGHVVAMTGDGVNDAPALKKADIGIAMGIKGSEVAKDASDMVITDDNFATIVYAIEQGRIIYSNIIRFVHYLFSCNLSEIFVIFVAIMLGWPLPLAAIQLLWLNMITDIFPALALVLEPSSPGMMHRPPRARDEPILTRSLAGLISLQASLLCVATLLSFGYGLHVEQSDASSRDLATTMAFSTLAFTQTLHALSARSQHRSIFFQDLFSNHWLLAAIIGSAVLQLAAVYLPLLQRVLHTIPLTPSQLTVVAACSVGPMCCVELLKYINRRDGFIRTARTSG